ncbi:N-acetylgalactosamine-6-sulfatase-like [Bolinopsis microptera]|uniref:N-acetylgalactosamine-6-sulfatase-like n=1 Tax=Bolinopsis microptera TaxID=2820187 RepID=UPI003078F205
MLTRLSCMVLCLTVSHCLVDRPNIIIMLMDDMGWGDVGINGNWAKETPFIDKMAAEGMLFTDFYTANPLCSPSRAALMTGRLPIRNGFYSTNAHARNAYTPQTIVGGIHEYEQLLPKLLKEADYKSKIIGKWHLGQRRQFLPCNRGFDEFFGSGNCHFGPFNDVKTPNMPVYKDDRMVGRYYTNFTINKATGQSNMSQLFLEEGLSFIESQSVAKNPFFLYWTPDATHDPNYSSPMFHGKSIRGRYGDAVMEMDYCVGQILKKLRELNIEKETFVFFTSDNGAATYRRRDGGDNGPFLCGKETTYEGGMREPGIAWWPGSIPAGTITHQLGNIMDLFTTSLTLAGVKPPQDRIIDGIDLCPVLLDQSAPVIDRPIWYYRGNEMMAVRVGAYKAHYWMWTEFGNDPVSFTFCQGQYIKNVTVHDQVDHSDAPVLFNVNRDPGEKYIIAIKSKEYKAAMAIINPIVKEHKANLVPGVPSLNYCDVAVQNWAPPGCEDIDYCLPVPDSNPKLCVWTH